MRWVYEVAKDLLPVSDGVYGADLGSDPRDAALAEKAFGSNGTRLARLKRVMDPYNVLAYACPLPQAPPPEVIVLVTGDSCAGKDYCGTIWASVHNSQVKPNNPEQAAHPSGHKCGSGAMARVVSISDVTKREYAKATAGVDLNRLLGERAYKEQHRPALTAFWNDQKHKRPRLPEEHFSSVVKDSFVDVLLITGIRDEAPVAAFSHLVPDSRLLEVNVKPMSR
jgi:hypothetical protein